MIKTIDLQQEYIEDEFYDCVYLATEIIGAKCCSTTIVGDREKGDANGTKYQILPDPYSVNSEKFRVNLIAFENYFYKNFGKWKDRSYFDTPAQAFFALIKAWNIWNKHLEDEIKAKYIDLAE